MRQDPEKTPSNLALVPAAAIKLAQQANREHQRATRSALSAIEHAVKAGQALIKARELCEFGLWQDFITEHFEGSLRTAQNYMRVARNWQQLATENPTALASQQQALKALTAIVAPDEKRRQRGAPAKNADLCASDAQNPGGAPAKNADLCASDAQTASMRGPVWRASGPFVREALKLVTAVEASLTELEGRGYPIWREAEQARDVLERLQAMIDGEIDEAEALYAAGEWTFVADDALQVTTEKQPKEGHHDLSK